MRNASLMRACEPRSSSSGAWLVAATLFALSGAGCGGDPAVTAPPVSDPAGLYWQLTLDVRAATLSTVSPYDTIRITATPRTISGTPIPDLPRPTYTSLDLDRAQVDSNGLVQVIGTGDQVFVVAELKVQNIMHRDTLVLDITDAAPPPVLTTFTIHPDTGDSAKTAEGRTATLMPRAYDADGMPMSDVSTYFTVSDPTIATIDRATGFLGSIRPGKLNVYATTTMYGVTKTDTLPYTIGHPVQLIMNIVPQVTASGQVTSAYSPANAELGPGAIILYSNQNAPATDVTFDDPTNVGQADEYCGFFASLCGSGNIDAWTRDPSDAGGFSALRARAFPVPGTYRFHSTLTAASGTIIIDDEHTP